MIESKGTQKNLENCQANYVIIKEGFIKKTIYDYLVTKILRKIQNLQDLRI